LATSRSLVLRSASCRAAQPPCSIACSVREGLHVPREPGYGSERSQAPIRRRRIGRAKRSGHAVSRGQDGRGERPATGHGQPRTVIEVMTAAIGAGLQRRERDPKANVRRRGTGSPEPPPQRQPCVCGYSSTSSATVM
jgi:hypothetical protein